MNYIKMLVGSLVLGLFACKGITDLQFESTHPVDKSHWTVNNSVDSTLANQFTIDTSAVLDTKVLAYKQYSTLYFSTEADCQCKLPVSLSKLVMLYNNIVEE